MMKKLIFVFCLLLPLPVSGQGWLFQRSTTAYKTFSAGGAHPTVSHMSEVAVGHPRVAGKGGGLLIESQNTNNCLQSQTFDHASWIKIRSSIIANSIISLDGTTTADTLHEDGTLNNTHHVVQGATTVSGNTYTFSVYSKPCNRNWVLLQLIGDAAGAYFNVQNGTLGTVIAGTCTSSWSAIEQLPDGWMRCSLTCTSNVTGANNIYIRVAEADNDVTFDGLNQDSLYIWQAQVEEQPFPTSPILTTTVPVTRTADDCTLDPHVSGTNEIVLPVSFTPAGPASKLTVYLEAKCQFEDNTEINVNHMLMSISGNTGAGARQADVNHNRMLVYVNSAAQIAASMLGAGGTDHLVFTTAADPVNFSEWFSVRAVFDFTDFSRMDMWVRQVPDQESNAGMTYANNNGSDSFYTDDTLIRMGQWYNGDINANCKLRNMRITPSEIRAP